MDGKKFFFKISPKNFAYSFRGGKEHKSRPVRDAFEACMRRCIMFLSAVGKSSVRAATVKILR